MIVLIDNYDSFVHNLARYIRLAGQETLVIRNDKISVQDILGMKPDGIVVSPGPSIPQKAGISIDTIKAAKGKIPVLGVCLGHQCIAEIYGGKTVKSAHPTHGQASDIFHDGNGIMKNIPSPFKAGRYHSLMMEGINQTNLSVDATTKDQEIMAISDIKNHIYGVQFHPESILTDYGSNIISNFLEVCQ
ncbi:MAG: aminodeoxychorismate/anthranilate synthase component II [Alphaproteobacteria bacterium]|jgi:para-aminobenzoate synthetase component 2|nr:aminodeoxychorismate/anthranilate synthase component II [Alphaproteobacteria bacterium]MCB1551041.1 aminodeoxychorismate/anthranilate synthase component II [Alphaproteobacteria bacterium]MCB9984600.1 aminodeoxychorismate/anthranilate synthase component II [Micavibrio sp.]HRK97943.1 aminodeoxychorismate/anthranilate synthase component II [Alphaproteobacteria bacterium]